MIELALAALQLASEPVDCRSQPDARVETTYQHSGETDYFPYGVVDAFECDWYSRILASLEEGPLLPDGAIFRLRFLEIPTWDYPMAITVTQRVDGVTLIEARASDGSGGYDPGKLVYREQSTLTAEELEILLREVDRANLCRRHPDDLFIKLPDGQIRVTADGTRNLFEWVSGTSYCLRDAQARQDNEMTKLAIWLVQRVFAFEVKPPLVTP